MTALSGNQSLQQGWVVFTGQTDLPWLKLLKPGYRHCFALLNDGTHWITFDPLSNYTEIAVHHVPVDFDLPRWFSMRGMQVVKADLKRIKRPAPWMIFTCVEAVKRVLGLHKIFIFTPWQLYRYLQRQSHIKGEFAWEV